MTNAVSIAQLGSNNSTMRNRIINGDMRIDQRNGGGSVTITSNSTYTLDRWVANMNQSSKFSVQRNAGAVTPPVGFTNYLGITSLSAYSIGSSDILAMSYNIEGLNVADFGWGTANAKTVTLSFWVRSSLTGTFGGALRNSGTDRSYPFTYTINSANTWEYETITIPGDTTGTWLTNNDIGIRIAFGLGVGSSNSGTAGSWSGSNLWSATGATSVVGTNGATFYITGVQLEAGSQATPFEYRSYGTELQLCQRYYAKSFAHSTVPANGIYSHYSGTFWEGSDNGKNEYVYLPVSMRVAPTFTLYGDSGRWQVYNGGAWVTSTQSIAGAITDRGFTVFIVGNISNSSLHPWYCKGDWVASAEL